MILTDKKIFVTGGAGFIGSTLIERLIEENEVAVYDNLTRDSLKSRDYANHPNLRVINGDVLGRVALDTSVTAAEPAGYTVEEVEVRGLACVSSRSSSILQVSHSASNPVAPPFVGKCEEITSQ